MALPSHPQFFDPAAEYTVAEGRLPHWEQAGVVAFVTFRTWDSMPREVIVGWLNDRHRSLMARGIDLTQPGWEAAFSRLPTEEQVNFRRFCSTRWDESLDRCHGSC